MTQVFRTVLATAVLAGLAAGQQKDTVVLTDGTTIKDVKITRYDVDQIEWRKSNATDSRPSDQVAEVECDRVRELYRRAYALGGNSDAPGTFVQIAEKEEDPFLKQFGYQEAAQLLMNAGEVAQAFAAYAELKTAVPTSAFTVEEYRTKMEYYLGLGPSGAGNAMKVATAYRNEAATKLTRGYQVESQLFVSLAKLARGDADVVEMTREFERITIEAAGYPLVQQRAKLVQADLLRQQDKLDEASKIYDELLEARYASSAVRGGALLGNGHVLLKRGSPADKETFREALLAFLRVYVERDGLGAGTIAEALFFGQQAARSWGGEDSSRMAAYLEFLLKRNYPESSWAKR